MARFLMATYPSPGHVAPAAAVVRELSGRGHDVRWYTGSRFAEVVADSGALFCPMAKSLDWHYNDFNSSFPGRADLKGLKQNQFDLAEIFVRPLRDHLPALKALLVDEPADVFVSHTVFLGGGWLHEMGGPPNATLGDTCLNYPSRDAAPYGTGLAPRDGWVGHLRNGALNAISRTMVMAPVVKAAREVRAELGLPPVPMRGLDFGLSPNLHIQLCPPGFEYPRSDLPGHVHFVGAPAPPMPAEFDPPRWWPRLSESTPVVLVTQGTIATEPADLLAPCLEGLASRDLFVVATTGGADPAVLGEPPSNAVVERFVPYSALLPHVDVMVSNGGFGSVQLAIAHGVPMVVAGTSEDKREVTAHVDWSGVGINLRTNRPSPKAIADAVQRALNDSKYRDRTQVLRAQTAGKSPAGAAAELLEELAVKSDNLVTGIRGRSAIRKTAPIKSQGEDLPGTSASSGVTMVERNADGLRGLTPKEQNYFRRGRRMALRFPWGPRLFSKSNRALFQLTGGRLGGRLVGVPIGLLTTTGRHSGRSRTVPVVYLDNGSRFLVAASNNGFDSPPAWCLNLQAHPNAEMRIRTGTERVVARQLTDSEHEEAWPRLLEHNPVAGAYQSCTERQFAVFALERLQKQGSA
jgi:MGT family glycosyltransferase/deazaflavin-dependent oxidoreductase (nitroreductase family)